MTDQTTDRPFRVLVVEDTPDQRDIIKITLRPMEVVTAVHGLDGLMKIDRVEPDFIISDVMMPEMDGWAFVARVRQRPGYQQTPVVFLTALTSRDDMRKGYETGCDVYLTKPYDPIRLKRNLDVIIEQMSLTPKPKRFTLAELEAEDKRIEAAPRVSTRETIRPDAVDEDESEVETPAPEPEVAPPPKLKSDELPARLLVLSADPLLPTQIKQITAPWGCEIVDAKESPEAMDKLSLYRPDALCLHWQLPNDRARVLVGLFSESPECRSMPIIIVSDKRLGFGEKRIIKNSGVFGSIRRPFKPSRMAELIEDINMISTQDARRSRMGWAQVQESEAGRAKKQSDEIKWSD